MSKPVDFANFINVKVETAESVDSTASQNDLSSGTNNISKFMDIDHYEERGGYGFVDAMHAIMKEDIEKQRRTIEAREKIGMIVTKIFAGGKHVGAIVDYDGARKWFKVEYTDGICEIIHRDEVDGMTIYDSHKEVDPNHTVPCLKMRAGEEKKKTVKGKKAQGCGGNQKETREGGKAKKSTGKKRGRPAKQPFSSPYAPLYAEKKKDAYYWY